MLLREYFVTEARELLDVMGRAGASEADSETVTELRRCARGLRGLARLANEPRVAEAASAVEQATRTLNVLAPQPELAGRVLASVADLRVLIDGGEDEGALDARRAAIVDRWSAPAGEDGVATVTAPTAEPAVPADSAIDAGFHAFMEREVTGIAEVLDRGIAAFVETPNNREWLGTILRRQRALMGVARLDDVASLAETLRAVEEMSELIVRLNVPIKSEWLDVFRSAREVLRASMASLQRGEPPAFTPALSRLRTLRDELRDRYGDKPPAHDRPQNDVAGRSAQSQIPTESKHERAARLRAEVDRAIGSDARAREALHELHTLLIDAWK